MTVTLRLLVMSILVTVQVLQSNTLGILILTALSLVIYWMIFHYTPRIEAEIEAHSRVRIARLADAYRLEQDRAAAELERLRLARRGLLARPIRSAA